ncbi:MAG: undecaprenyl-phosphate glucose phosphotransferase [Bacteroidetes bacterium]|nr:undecaprenyl-phosphate glucose phosphotransferase [Bacteroidota bacterium]
MGKKYFFYYRFFLIFGDYAIINTAFLLTVLIKSYFSTGGVLELHFGDFLFFNFSWLLSTIVMNLYSHDNLQVIERTLRQTIKAIILQIAIFLAYLYLSKETVPLRIILYCYSFFIAFFILSRILFTHISEVLIGRVNKKKPVAILGQNDTGKELAELFASKKSDYKFRGFFEDSENGGTAAVMPFKPIEKCIQFAANNQIEEIYSTIFPTEENWEALAELADKKCVRLKFVSKDITPSRQGMVNYFNEFPVISIRKEPLEAKVENRAKKRIFDIVFSFFITVFILSWLIPIVGIIIKLNSKGPVFFIQNRPGRNNQLFKIIKFRTMTVTESDGEFKQATKNDARITSVGRFLRKTSLDEMPQFLNVLLGQMSIVGPRPHPVKLNLDYQDQINSFMARHFVKPGITGWAQVNGYRGETETEESMKKRIEHDLWYMENWSLMLDIRIVFLTIANIIKGEPTAY